MTLSDSPIGWFVLLCLCGCPLGSPRDHIGQSAIGDNTLDVSPTDDAIVFNATEPEAGTCFCCGSMTCTSRELPRRPSTKYGPVFRRTARHWFMPPGFLAIERTTSSHAASMAAPRNN